VTPHSQGLCTRLWLTSAFSALQFVKGIRAHADFRLFTRILRRYVNAPRAIVAILRHRGAGRLLYALMDAGLAAIKCPRARFEELKKLPGVVVSDLSAHMSVGYNQSGLLSSCCTLVTRCSRMFVRSPRTCALA
jgi:hypothetical protein